MNLVRGRDRFRHFESGGRLGPGRGPAERERNLCPKGEILCNGVHCTVAYSGRAELAPTSTPRQMAKTFRHRIPIINGIPQSRQSRGYSAPSTASSRASNRNLVTHCYIPRGRPVPLNNRLALAALSHSLQASFGTSRRCDWRRRTRNRAGYKLRGSGPPRNPGILFEMIWHQPRARLPTLWLTWK